MKIVCIEENDNTISKKLSKINGWSSTTRKSVMICGYESFRNMIFPSKKQVERNKEKLKMIKNILREVPDLVS